MSSDLRVVKLSENIGARVDGVRLGELDGNLHQRQIDISRRDVAYEICDNAYEKSEKYHWSKIVIKVIRVIKVVRIKPF